MIKDGEHGLKLCVVCVLAVDINFENAKQKTIKTWNTKRKSVSHQSIKRTYPGPPIPMGLFIIFWTPLGPPRPIIIPPRPRIIFFQNLTKIQQLDIWRLSRHIAHNFFRKYCIHTVSFIYSTLFNHSCQNGIATSDSYRITSRIG